MLFDKKGQVSEAIVWLIATTIIVVVLVISVYAASAISKSTRTVNSLDVSGSAKSDIIAKESLFAYLLTKNNEKIFYKEIESNNEISGVAKDFGMNVFNKVGVGKMEIILRFNKNANAADFVNPISSTIVEKVNTDKNSAVELSIKYITKGATI